MKILARLSSSTRFGRWAKTTTAASLAVISIGFASAQTTIQSTLPGGGAFPAGWSGVNNVITQPIDQGTYWLVQPGTTKDLIVTGDYNLALFSSITVNVNVATYDNGTARSLLIEYSTDSGASWNPSTFTTATPSSSSPYITGGPVTIAGTFTSTTRLRFSANGTSGRGVRIQGLGITGLSLTAPTITSFTPTTGWTGDTVTITGTNLTGTSAVTFNGTAGTSVNVVNATQVTVVVPAAPTTGKIALTTPEGTVQSATDFTAINPNIPTISSFAPSTGWTGDSVVITGTGFAGTTSVTFSGANATSFTIDSATQITAVVPTAPTTGKIALTTPGGSVTSANNFTAVNPDIPTITSFSPTTGWTGDSVVITGSGFTGATSVSNVTFNGVSATSFTVNSATQITAVVPSAPTTGKIAVIKPSGTATSVANFTAFNPNTLTLSASPTSFAENASNPASTGTVTRLGSTLTDLVVTLTSSAPTRATVPATVTILAGQTTANFDITAVPDNIVAPDSVVTLTASAGDFSIGTNVTVTNVDIAPPTVVVNKYLNATPDLVELLVVGNGVTGNFVDMRGMILKDFSSSMADDSGGSSQFSTNAIWSAVPVGTLIVLSDDTTAADVDSSDYLLKVGRRNTTYFSFSGSFDVSTTDMVMIKSAGSGTAGTTGGIHALAGGTAGTQFNNFIGPKLIATGTSGTGKAVIANNSTSSLADFNGTGATGNLSLTALDFGKPSSPGNLAYINALRGIVNMDGDGIATVVNATPSSPYAATTIFGRNLTGQTATVTVTAVSSAAPITNVRVTVPASFGAPLIGNITLGGAGGTAATVSGVSGQVITISGSAVTPTNPMTIQIAGLVTPNPVALTDTGLANFQIETAGSGGTLTALATSPNVRVIIPIANLRDVNGTVQPLDLGTTVAVEGVCTMGNYSTTGTSAFIQSENFGVSIANAADLGLVRGNRYAVLGTVTFSNGLTEVTPAGASNVINLGADTGPTAFAIDLPTLLATPEQYEGRLLKVSGLSKTSGTWAVNSTVNLQDAGSNAIDVRIRSASTATVEPAYPAEITGVLGQFDSTGPFSSGYQIMPRDTADVVGSTSTGYDSWNDNLDNQTADQDFDGDGLDNGTEYFMGTAGNAFTPNPGVVAGAITWPRAGDTTITAWRVDVSTDLVVWENATVNYNSNLNTSSPSQVVFTMPTTPPKFFVRLRVEP
jgi:hypothetical protein